ncbi:MAG: hypothetical protein NTZ32_05715 [Planctomycetales bacterium]|nr:hypothetical protein [Planctomycetales bacterium]
MPDKDDEARKLAEAHYGIEEGITGIFRLVGTGDAEANSSEPIKLLEVNQHTIASGVMPLQFAPQPAYGFHFSSVIVEVTPEEFGLIQRHQLALPHDWEVGAEFPRPTSVAP